MYTRVQNRNRVSLQSLEQQSKTPFENERYFKEMYIRVQNWNRVFKAENQDKATSKNIKSRVFLRIYAESKEYSSQGR